MDIDEAEADYKRQSDRIRNETLLSDESNNLSWNVEDKIFEFDVGYRIIGESAFASSKVGRITFCVPVEFIMPFAFSNCKKLVELTLPDGLTHIGNGAFWGCKKLKSITIPSSVEFIGEDVFGDCLKSLTVRTPKGSEAEQYAIENRIKVKTY